MRKFHYHWYTMIWYSYSYTVLIIPKGILNNLCLVPRSMLNGQDNVLCSLGRLACAFVLRHTVIWYIVTDSLMTDESVWKAINRLGHFSGPKRSGKLLHALPTALLQCHFEGGRTLSAAAKTVCQKAGPPQGKRRLETTFPNHIQYLIYVSVNLDYRIIHILSEQLLYW